MGSAWDACWHPLCAAAYGLISQRHNDACLGECTRTHTHTHTHTLTLYARRCVMVKPQICTDKVSSSCGSSVTSSHKLSVHACASAQRACLHACMHACLQTNYSRDAAKPWHVHARWRAYLHTVPHNVENRRAVVAEYARLQCAVRVCYEQVSHLARAMAGCRHACTCILLCYMVFVRNWYRHMRPFMRVGNICWLRAAG